MDGFRSPYARGLIAVVGAIAVAAPLPRIAFSVPTPETTPAPAMEPRDVADAAGAAADPFLDGVSRIAITPPAGWVRSPATALDPLSDPPEPVAEVARFQVRVGDAQLYAAPIPITSGLVADAGAVISIGVAREGSDVLDIDRTVRGTRELGSVPGFTSLEDEATYEGLHVMTRYLFSRESDRVLVARAAALEDSWAAFAPVLRASLLSFTGDPRGANAAAAPLPPPPPAPEPAPDPTMAVRNAIIERATSLIGLRYVWGGNSTAGGMDCSAYVSWTWSVPRYTTDSIGNVASPITKEELRPGDALNLTTGRDPQHLGHIRLFDAWANTEHSAMWVYEETPPRVVHRVVAYDARYQPIRLAGLSGAGEVKLIPGVPAPVEITAPRRTATPTYRRTPTPTRTRTLAPWPSWFERWTPRPVTSSSTRPPSMPSPSPTPKPSITRR